MRQLSRNHINNNIRSWPIFAFIFDCDIDPDIALKYPQLY